jgi:hypothetical protein
MTGEYLSVLLPDDCRQMPQDLLPHRSGDLERRLRFFPEYRRALPKPKALRRRKCEACGICDLRDADQQREQRRMSSSGLERKREHADIKAERLDFQVAQPG